MNFDPTWVDIALLVPLAFAGAFVYGVTGFGSSLVSIPLATHFVPLPFALATFCVIDWITSIRVMVERPRNIVRGEWVRMASTIIIGSVLGMTALFHLPRGGAMLALGVFVIAYAVYAMASRRDGPVVDQRWAYVAGVGGGVSGTLFGAGGPPYAIYLTHRPVTKEQYRATLSATSVVSISIRLVAYIVTGLLADADAWLAAACTFPGAMAGLWAGTRIFHRINRVTMVRFIALLLLVMGASLIVRAVRLSW